MVFSAEDRITSLQSSSQPPPHTSRTIIISMSLLVMRHPLETIDARFKVLSSRIDDKKNSAISHELAGPVAAAWLSGKIPWRQGLWSVGPCYVL
jgi:hypothetical protein